MPLALIIDGANRMACTLVEATLDHLMITRPPLTEEEPQHMCLDAGDDYEATSVTLQAHQDEPLSCEHLQPLCHRESSFALF